MRDIEGHFKRKRKFAISILLLMVAGWGVFSFYIIFIRLGWDDVQHKMRIHRELSDTSRAMKSGPIKIVRGWPVASTREKIDVDAVKRKLVQTSMTELKKIFREPPYIQVKQFSAWKQNCYLGLNIAIYPGECLKNDIPREQAYDKVRTLFSEKLNEMFPRDSDFFKKLPSAEVKNNNFKLGPELKNIKIPKRLRLMSVYSQARSELLIFNRYVTYPDMWDVKYDSSSAELVEAERINRRKGTCVIEIPVENSRGEQYRMLVRVKNK